VVCGSFNWTSVGIATIARLDIITLSHYPIITFAFLPSPPNAAAQRTSVANANGSLPHRCRLAGYNVINPEHFENILEPYEGFYILVVAVYVKCVGACYEVPFQAVEHWDLVGQ
jgi:hypothetical protein